MPSIRQGTIAYTFRPRNRAKKRTSWRLNVLGITKILIIFISLLGLGIWFFFLFQEYLHVYRLKKEIEALQKKQQVLIAEYEKLTQKDLVYSKAKKLGLHKARPEQIIRIR